MKPLITIITAVYNQEEHITRCVESAKKQSYKNWEMIIIDDCSTDRSLSLIKYLAKNDKRISVVRHRKNYGIKNLHLTYNEGIKMSRGELIAFLESDDFWPQDKLSRQISSFDNDKVILSYGDAIITNSTGLPVSIVTYPGDLNELNNKPVGSILHRFVDVNFFLLVSTMMVRKSAFIKVGGFRKDPYFVFVDLPTWCDLALQGQFSYRREILGYYRRHKKSFWMKSAAKTDAMLREEIQDSFWAFIDRNKKKLAYLKFHLNKGEAVRRQNQLIEKRKKGMRLSIFINTLLFNDKSMLRQTAKDAMGDKTSSFNQKFMIFIIMKMGSTIKLLLVLNFYRKLAIYQIRKLTLE